MCQLCNAAQVAAGLSRWPDQMQPLVEELKLLFTTAHNEAANLAFSQNALKKSTASEIQTTHGVSVRAPSKSVAQDACEEFRLKIITTLKGVLANLDLLDSERQKWWNDPTRKRIRNQTAETYDPEKYKNLNMLNNDVKKKLSDIRTKVGLFSRWQIGIEAKELGDA